MKHLFGVLLCKLHLKTSIFPKFAHHLILGGVAEYRSSEGKTVEVPYKGDVEETVLDILGGLRSACTYTGAGKLKELPRRATFIRCTQQLNTIYS